METTEIKGTVFDRMVEKKFGPKMGEYLYLRCQRCNVVNLPKEIRDNTGSCKKCGHSYYVPVKSMNIIEEISIVVRAIW